MKKETKNEKFNEIFSNVDYAQLVKDLNTVEGFTEENLKMALKLQKKGISVHVNAAFYKNLVTPFTKKLQDRGLLTIRKVAGTRFYTITDRQKAIELFRKAEKKPGQKPTDIIVAPVAQTQPRPVSITPIGKVDLEAIGTKHHSPHIRTRSDEEIMKAINPSGRLSKKYMQLEFENWLLIFGYLSRENKNEAYSKEIMKQSISYFGSRVQLKQYRAYFNSFMDRLGEQFTIYSIGKTVNSKLGVKGIKPRYVLDFLVPFIKEHFTDDRIINLISWALGESNELPKMVKKEKVKAVVIKKDDAPELKTMWIITKMDLSEFQERYHVESSVELESEKGNLIQFHTPEENIEKIRTELRKGEKLLEI